MDKDIRNQIIVPNTIQDYFVKTCSNIELAALFSKNKNNLKILEKLLLQIKNKNDIPNDLLMKTIQRETMTTSFDAIKLLIKYGADVNLIDDGDRPILIYCCLSEISNIKITELLIESGADVNIKYMTRTPLMYFIRNCYKNEDLKIVKLLIRKTNKINYKSEFGETTLMICFESKTNIFIKYEIIKLLLENKADIYIKNDEGKNILKMVTLAIAANNKQKCKYLDIYSLIFNYKNIKNDHFCEYDTVFIYNNFK